MARMAEPGGGWEEAPSAYAPRRARSPTRGASNAELVYASNNGSTRGGALMDRGGGGGIGALEEAPGYYDDRDGAQYGNGGQPAAYAPRGSFSQPPKGGSFAQQPPPGYAPQLPPGYGPQYGGPSMPGGWAEEAGVGAPHGNSGSYGPTAALHRRGGFVGAPDPSEQWRSVQASMGAQMAASKLAAELAARRQAKAGGAARQWVSYAGRRAWYLVDSKIGTLKYQVLALVGVAVVISVSGGKLVELVRNMAVDEGLLENYTTYSDGVWLAWSLIIDPGYGTWPDSVVGVRMRATTVIIAIIGILYLSVIIALIVDAVQVKMEDLKKGLSPVVEARHTVVLGWAEQSLTIIRELASANASEGGGIVAVLSDADKQDMERELASFITPAELRGTKVVFRSGSRLRTADMRRVAIEAARSVIIVSDVRLDPDTADAEVLQVVLNLTTLDLAPGCSVVAEVRDVDNEPLVMLVGGDLVRTVTSHDIIGRLMLLFVRQPGLARVYSSVLGFEGSEFYVEHWDALTGARWRDVAVRFPDAVPIGVQRRDGTVLINPPPGYVIRAGDGLIVLAEDNDTYTCEEPADIGPRRTFRPMRDRSLAPEAVLFAGWRRDVAHMIGLLDRLAPPGSELHMLCTLSVAERCTQIAENGMNTDALHNLRIIHHVGNTAVKRHMDMLPLERLTSAIVLSDHGEETDMINSDSHCLATLLLIRGLQAGRNARVRDAATGGPPGGAPSKGSGTGIDMWSEAESPATSVPIVVEILDPRTQRTVNESYKVWSVADFIQSNELISKMLAMISEEPSVKSILDNLLGGTGTQLAVAPAEEYISPEQDASFFELARECMLTRHQVLCGYVLPPQPGERALPECVINPADKLARHRWRRYTLIVITTDDQLAATAPAASFWEANGGAQGMQGMDSSMHGGMHDSIHGGMQGGSMHGGMQGGSMHGGMQGGSMHGGMQGSMHGGMQGGMQGGGGGAPYVDDGYR